jgi:hypothetical protein
MRKLDNKTLDEIGRILVKSPAVRPEDLEKIVSDPSLFDSIRLRISQEKRPEASAQRRTYTPRIRFAFAGAVVVVAALAFVFAALRGEKPTIAVRRIPVPATQAKPTQFAEPDTIGAPLPDPVREIAPQKASVSTPSPRISRPSSKAVADVHYEGDFYALSYAGDPHETDRGGRIIRVDIPRSTLFAMGVNIPLENEAEMVKTDLLVGTDGVTRAIRVVR